MEWNILIKEGATQYKQGNYTKAVRFIEEALKVAEEHGNPDHPKVATSLNNLANLYETQGNYSKAEPLYKRSAFFD
jgi:tetratricopeptide (TPR) repeat protein